MRNFITVCTVLFGGAKEAGLRGFSVCGAMYWCVSVQNVNGGFISVGNRHQCVDDTCVKTCVKTSVNRFCFSEERREPLKREATKSVDAGRANARRWSGNVQEYADWFVQKLLFFHEILITQSSWKMSNHTNIWGTNREKHLFTQTTWKIANI